MLPGQIAPHAHRLQPSLPQKRDAEVGCVGTREVEPEGLEFQGQLQLFEFVVILVCVKPHPWKKPNFLSLRAISCSRPSSFHDGVSNWLDLMQETIAVSSWA